MFDSGYAYTIRDEAKNITFLLQIHMENLCSWVGIDDLIDATNRNQTLLDEITSTNRNDLIGSTS